MENQDLEAVYAVAKATKFAAAAHHGQLYGGDQPYTVHLQHVFDVLWRFDFHDCPHLLIAAQLHDVLEDTPVNYHTLKKEFGEHIAELVYAVTNELGRNRKERHEKTLPKIQANPDAILLKLADRIANTEAAQKTSSSHMRMYAREYVEFREALYPHSPERAHAMWKHLDELMLYVPLQV